MKHNLSKRLRDLEVASVPEARIRYMIRWSSQDPDEAKRRWKESLEERGDPLGPTDQIYCVVFNDATGTHSDKWENLRAPSWPGEARLQGSASDAD